MHLLQVILSLLLLVNSRTAYAVAELSGLIIHQKTLKILDCAFEPCVFMAFAAMELHNGLFTMNEQRLGSGLANDVFSFCFILAFLIGSYTIGYFWGSNIDLFEHLAANFIRSTTLAVAVVIPCIDNVASYAMGQLRKLWEHRRAVLSIGAALALAFPCCHLVATHIKSILLYGLVFALVIAFAISALVLVIGVAKGFFILASCIVSAYLNPSNISANRIRPSEHTRVPVTSRNVSNSKVHGNSHVNLQDSEISSKHDCSPSNNNGHIGSSPVSNGQSSAPKPSSSPQTDSGKSSGCSAAKSNGHTRANSGSSGSSKPSVPRSTSSDQPSRPSTRTSVSEPIDHEQCLHNVRVFQMALEQVANENTQLAADKTELSTENAHLKSDNEGLRRQMFMAEENFEEHLKSLKYLEAANAELRIQLEHQCRLNLKKDAEFDERIKTFINNFFPQFDDIASSSLPTTPSSGYYLPSSSKTPTNATGSPVSHLSIITNESSTPRGPQSPATVSSGPSLPFSPATPSTCSRIVSPNSLRKPFRNCTPGRPGLPTPEALNRKPDPTVKMVGPSTPATVSSGFSLPCPSEFSAQSSSAISPALLVHLPARVGNGPGLTSPLPMLIGDKLPRPERLSTPSTVSSGTALPVPTPTTKSSSTKPVPVKSLLRPNGARFSRNSRYESPLARLSSIKRALSLRRSGFATPENIDRPQRFSNFLDFEDSPATVSSSSTLPMPSPGNNSSTCDPFI
ncbi:uncharacterized protein J3D65DRAFT_49253 [Phyllosticta citribraziliensis]|uniref:Uncharacterized protein n=1 Tax=Phyllosticta citribraziliensis TaxID=989973 RepID=A0ABR1MB57_9PEZI